MSCSEEEYCYFEIGRSYFDELMSYSEEEYFCFKTGHCYFEQNLD